MQAPEIVRVLATPLQLAFDLGWSEAASLGVQGGAALSCRRPGTGGLLSVAAVGGQPRGTANGRSSFVSHQKQYNIFLYPCEAYSSRLLGGPNHSPASLRQKAESRRQEAEAKRVAGSAELLSKLCGTFSSGAIPKTPKRVARSCFPSSAVLLVRSDPEAGSAELLSKLCGTSRQERSRRHPSRKAAELGTQFCACCKRQVLPRGGFVQVSEEVSVSPSGDGPRDRRTPLRLLARR